MNNETRDKYRMGSVAAQDILAVDFETLPDGRIFHIGAVLGDQSLDLRDISDIKAALNELDAFSRPAACLLGHNIIVHDIPAAKAVLPGASFLDLPVIDTLFLSPLAFPENPYHSLVKDYKLVRSGKNDPVADARLSLAVFEDQAAALRALEERRPGILGCCAFAFEALGRGMGELFAAFGGDAFSPETARNAFLRLIKGKVCENGFDAVWQTYAGDADRRVVLAYVLSWVMVAGSNSVIPPWVGHRFPKIADIIRTLRYACADDTCEYCRANNDAVALLKKYFGFDSYRNLPDGRPLQQEVIEAGLQGVPLLGILPTGGGKSICYQIPALHRYHRLGELTVIISPLKALMKDQVDNLNRATGTEVAAAINGSLTLPERGAVMEKVRLGDVGILYISPEQLRNRSVADLIRSRTVGCWVFDEAHCLSKWGHDFRPDYLHVAEFIAAYGKAVKRPPLVGTFTATAKKDVIEEIISHLKEKLSIDLASFIGGGERDNLSFQVWPVTRNEKYDVILNCLQEGLAENGGGAIVYCASRRRTEEVSDFLNERGILSHAFHAGRSEPDKRNIQDDFVAGAIPVICATNAFGMGIDKKDIRLVIHADIPGSLENYLQEAGRAGRDLMPSECILLYEQADIESQFSLNALSRLSLKDVKKILGILKKRGTKTPEVIITPGEIARIMGQDPDDGGDARARIGLSWLERKGFIRRDFNRTLFFQGTPMVRDMADAAEKMERLGLSRMKRRIFSTILHFFFNADPNALMSADDICTELGKIKDLPDKYLDSREVISLLSDMAKTGLVREGVIMSAFIRPKGKNKAVDVLDYFSRAEKKMAGLMAEMAAESGIDTEGEAGIFNLRRMSQRLKDAGFDRVNTEAVERILRCLANDKGETGGKSLKITGRRGTDQRWVRRAVDWDTLGERMARRHQAAGLIIEAIIRALPASLRSGQAEVLAKFFISDILADMTGHVFLSGFKGDTRALVERSLLYLHDIKALTLQNGLGVFRQAFTLELTPGAAGRRYTKADYAPLSLHYDQKNVQVHVMEKFALLGLEKIRTALNFVADYFTASHEDFIRQYFPGEKKIIHTAMTAQSYRQIVQSLENDIQETVTAMPQDRNLLVLAGPGSGKTRLIVHRCAWLMKAKSIDPSAILVLCYNHRAMLELRKRIRALAGRMGSHITAMTFHGFAMRICGRAFAENSSRDPKGEAVNFDGLIDEAVDILRGNREVAGLGIGMDGDEARELLLARYRYILVDEYQDIDRRQYDFISALTGRMAADADARISIMAVGDDDQSIYAFRNANVEFIRRFKEDYDADTFYLVENYRSSFPIITAANAFIARNRDRMKTDHPICINRRRKAEETTPAACPPDRMVQLVRAPDLPSQAVFIAGTIKKILAGNPALTPGDIAVVSRLGIGHPPLVALRMALAREGIDFCYPLKAGGGFPVSRLREIRHLLNHLETRKKESLRPADLKSSVMETFSRENNWTALVGQMLDAWENINPDMAISLARAHDFIWEALAEERQEHKTGTGVFSGTVHSVKGMEFPVVFILDGGWRSGTAFEMEEERRLFYVGMTRAERQLYICATDNSANPHINPLAANGFVTETSAPKASIPGFSEDITVSVLGMSDIYLRYPGLRPDTDEIHKRLTRLETGDRVQLIKKGGHMFITDRQGGILSRLSNNAGRKWQACRHHILSARVMGIVGRKRSDEDDNSPGKIRTDSWELPIVEILHRRF